VIKRITQFSEAKYFQYLQSTLPGQMERPTFSIIRPLPKVTGQFRHMAIVGMQAVCSGSLSASGPWISNAHKIQCLIPIGFVLVPSWIRCMSKTLGLLARTTKWRCTIIIFDCPAYSSSFSECHFRDVKVWLNCASPPIHPTGSLSCNQKQPEKVECFRQPSNSLQCQQAKFPLCWHKKASLAWISNFTSN